MFIHPILGGKLVVERVMPYQLSSQLWDMVETGKFFAHVPVPTW